MGLSGHTHGYPNISWFIMVYHHLPSENGFLKMAISQYASIPIFMQAHDTICHPWYPLVVAFDLGLATAGFPNSKVGRRQLWLALNAGPEKTHTQRSHHNYLQIYDYCDVHFSNVVFSVTYWREMLNGFIAHATHISRKPTRSRRLRGPRTNWKHLANFNGSTCFNTLLEETSKANNIFFAVLYPFLSYQALSWQVIRIPSQNLLISSTTPRKNRLAIN